jgi:hypothetical protein
MASLLYLKHAFNLSDEELVIRWSENVVWQYFSGQVYYTPKLPCRRKWSNRLTSNVSSSIRQSKKKRSRIRWMSLAGNCA